MYISDIWKIIISWWNIIQDCKRLYICFNNVKILNISINLYHMLYSKISADKVLVFSILEYDIWCTKTPWRKENHETYSSVYRLIRLTYFYKESICYTLIRWGKVGQGWTLGNIGPLLIYILFNVHATYKASMTYYFYFSCRC